MTDATNPASPQPPATPHAEAGPTPPPPPAPPYGTASHAAAPYGSSPYGNPTQAPPSYAAPQYPASAYGQQPAVYGYGQPEARTNVLAIISLVASIIGLTAIPFLGSVAGVITGHMALRQLKTSGEKGRGLALGGTIVGWIGAGFWILVIVVSIIAFFAWGAVMIDMSNSWS